MDTVQYVLSGYLPYVLFRLPSKHALQAALLTCYSGFLPYVLFRLPALPAVQAIPTPYVLCRLPALRAVLYWRGGAGPDPGRQRCLLHAACQSHVRVSITFIYSNRV